MPSIQQITNLLNSEIAEKLFLQLYGHSQNVVQSQVKRYQKIIENFRKYFGDDDIHLFSTPGRTEISGNHTDHNAGIVLAASINLDSVAAAAKINENKITIVSDIFQEPFEVFLDNLNPKKEETGTTAALIRGIAARFEELHFQIGGFNAYISSDVLIGSGLSSSASVEILFATILNYFYNEGRIQKRMLASISQFAENVYFGKPSGLMDQLACAMGGIISIDFKDMPNPAIKGIQFDFNSYNYRIIVVDTGGNHADLTDDYAAIPIEMQKTANYLGHKRARELQKKDVLDNLKMLRAQVGDRAILRTLHFLAENQRVVQQVRFLETNHFREFLALVNESGNSSNKWLQNSYSLKHPNEQGINLALVITEEFLKRIGEGACRVHGGGFAGTIQVFLPKRALAEYIQMMKNVFSQQNVIVLQVRALGTIHLDLTNDE